jgi:hypothetical protein
MPIRPPARWWRREAGTRAGHRSDLANRRRRERRTGSACAQKSDLQRRAARADLNAILHPLIRTTCSSRSCRCRSLCRPGNTAAHRGRRSAIESIASWWSMWTRPCRLQRLTARDGSTSEQARAILAAQASRSARLSAADDVLPIRAPSVNCDRRSIGCTSAILRSRAKTKVYPSPSIGSQ